MPLRPPHDPTATRTGWWAIFDPRTNLPARAAVFVGGSILVFTVLIAWLAGISQQRHLEQQLGSAFENSAFQISDKIERTIYARYRELQFAASLIGPTTTPAQRRRVLEQLQTSVPDFAWLGYADPTGRITAATAEIFEETSVDRQEWFLSAQEMPYMGAPREHQDLAEIIPDADAESPRRFLTLAVPIPGANGRPGGVLGAQLHWSWARDAQLSVISGAAKQQKLGVTLYSATRDVLLDSGASGWSRPLPPPANADARRSRGWMLEPADGNVTYLTGFVFSRGFREYRGLGWITAVRQPGELAFAPVAALRRAIVGAGMLVAAGLGAVAWVFGRRHARRLDIITAAAGRIHEGDVLTVIPAAQGDTEVDRLCHAVGSLVEDLRPKSAPEPDVAPLARPTYSPVDRIQRSV